MTSRAISKPNKNFSPSGLYLVTDRDLCTHHSLKSVIEASVRGGVSIVQLREKSCSTKEFIELALEVKNLLKYTNVPLLINDRIDVALAVEADGVHLGQNDMPSELARKILGENAIIGLSIENFDQVNKIQMAANLNYIGVSPIFETTTKTDTKGAFGIQGLSKIRKMTSLPLVAIGGINEANAESVIAAGADSLAVVSYLCSSKNPEESAKHLLSFFY